MNKKTLFGLIMVLMLSIFVVGCSEKSNAEEPEEKDKNEEKESAKEEDADKEKEEESTIPEDEALFAVLEENMKTMQEDDIDAYMETIHPDSPAYDSTKQVMEQMSAYKLDIELSNLAVEEKSEKEAIVTYTQKSMKIDGPEYQNNEISGSHTLKPDDDGNWKIFNSEATEQLALDEDGEVIGDLNEVVAMGEETSTDGEVVMEGEYVELLTDLEMPFGENWEIVNYEEENGEGLAEFMNLDEEMAVLSLHVIEDGEELIGVEGLIDSMKHNISELDVDDLKFDKKDVSGEEGFYDYTIKDDEVEEFNEEEIGRVFVQDGNLFVIRYTMMEGSIDKKDDWFDKFKQVK